MIQLIMKRFKENEGINEIISDKFVWVQSILSMKFAYLKGMNGITFYCLLHFVDEYCIW